MAKIAAKLSWSRCGVFGMGWHRGGKVESRKYEGKGRKSNVIAHGNIWADIWADVWADRVRFIGPIYGLIGSDI